MITNCRPASGLGVGGLPVSALYCGRWFHQALSLSFFSLSLYIRPLYRSKVCNWEATCLCRVTGAGPSPSSQSLPSVLPKNTEQIKTGDCVCLPDCGKGTGTGTGAGKTREWLRDRDVCMQPICVLKAGNDSDMFGLQLLICCFWPHLCKAFRAVITLVPSFLWGC